MGIDLSKLKKTNAAGFYKDPETGAVVNLDEDQLRSFEHARAKSLQLNALQQSHDKLESELDKIKKALGI